MFTFDAHLDLSLNALEYNRDLREPLAKIRELEKGKTFPKGRERGTVCFPEMRKADIGLCVATQLAGCMKPAAPVGAWNSPPQAHAMTQAQLAWYRAMEDEGELKQLTTWAQIEAHVQAWKADPANTPIGYILSLEGADSLRTLADLERSYAQGLRALGPAHYGIGRYALGHDQSGPLGDMGKELVKEMDRLGMILDATHLCDQNLDDALDLFQGPVWASHHNCRAQVDDPRQLSDQHIRRLAERGAVFGIAMDVWMVVPGWIRTVTTHETMPGADLEALANHVDHYAQLLGTTKNIMIGSDLDGGYGYEQTPAGIESIADITKFFDILRARGYSKEDIECIASGNALRFLQRALG
jgi:membrane dipeptidase